MSNKQKQKNKDKKPKENVSKLSNFDGDNPKTPKKKD